MAKISIVVAVTLLGGFALITAATFFRTLPCMMKERLPKRSELEGVITISDAVDHCAEPNLKGCALIEYAQHLVPRKMEYSYCNSWDSPARAFARGAGYCWHQTGALHRILRALGFNTRMVYATKYYFPEKNLYSGHVWLRVRVDGLEKDVCSGNEDNSPGVLHLIVVSRVKEWNPIIALFSYYGSAWLNAKRYASLR